MDNGGYKIIYDDGYYQIDDCGEYFAIYEKHKQVAAFKTKDGAFEYCSWKRYYVP